MILYIITLNGNISLLAWFYMKRLSTSPYDLRGGEAVAFFFMEMGRDLFAVLTVYATSKDSTID
jgi:hypothetical protein